jgi:MFS family permease
MGPSISPLNPNTASGGLHKTGRTSFVVLTHKMISPSTPEKQCSQSSQKSSPSQPLSTQLHTPPTPQELLDHDHEIPDGGYGWIIVFAVCIINAFTWGVLASYGVYLAYYLSTSQFPSATPRDYAFIGGLNFGLAVLVSSPATYLVRTFGTHRVMLLGVLLQTSGFIAASFVTKIWHLYLSQGACVGLGVGFLFIPSVAVTSQWFDKKRSLANSLTSAGSGLGGVIVSFATQPVIDHLSLAWSLRIIGLLSGSMNIIATCLIRTRNHIVRPPMHPFDVRLLRRLPVLLLLAWGFFSMLGYMVLLYSLSDFGRAIGLSASQASSITALLNLGTMLGRPCIGLLSDRSGRIEVAGCTTLACSIFVWAFWVPAKSYALLVVFALLIGGILGIFWMVSPLRPVFPHLRDRVRRNAGNLGKDVSSEELGQYWPAP